MKNSFPLVFVCVFGIHSHRPIALRLTKPNQTDYKFKSLCHGKVWYGMAWHGISVCIYKMFNFSG